MIPLILITVVVIAFVIGLYAAAVNEHDTGLKVFAGTIIAITIFATSLVSYAIGEQKANAEMNKKIIESEMAHYSVHPKTGDKMIISDDPEVDALLRKIQDYDE